MTSGDPVAGRCRRAWRGEKPAFGA